MGNDNKLKSTKNGKDSDDKFRSKHVKHDPAAESARAVFGLAKPDAKEGK
ncbi:MAG: CPC_1213 family protein [Oscillospiraceae bacterium]